MCGGGWYIGAILSSGVVIISGTMKVLSDVLELYHVHSSAGPFNDQ